MFKRKKKNDYEQIFNAGEELLVAYIIRGSVSSLFRYINTHRVSATEARRDIIRIKYFLSKCNRTVYGVIKKMVNDFEKFEIEDESHYVFSDDDVYTYTVNDIENKLEFSCYDGSIGHPHTITMGWGSAELTTDPISHKMFVYAIKCNLHIHRNIKEFERDKEHQELKQKYINAYR